MFLCALFCVCARVCSYRKRAHSKNTESFLTLIHYTSLPVHKQHGPPSAVYLEHNGDPSFYNTYLRTHEEHCSRLNRNVQGIEPPPLPLAANTTDSGANVTIDGDQGKWNVAKTEQLLTKASPNSRKKSGKNLKLRITSSESLQGSRPVPSTSLTGISSASSSPSSMHHQYPGGRAEGNLKSAFTHNYTCKHARTHACTRARTRAYTGLSPSAPSVLSSEENRVGKGGSEEGSEGRMGGKVQKGMRITVSLACAFLGD